MSMTIDFFMKRNDTLPQMSAVLRDEQGQPVDLTDATVRFHMKSVDGDTPKIDREGQSVGDPTTGRVTYDWTTEDTDEAGVFFAEWEVSFAGGDQATYPNDGYYVVQVLADLA